MAPAEASTGVAGDQQPTQIGARTSTHRLPPIDAVGQEGILGSADGTGLRIALACSRFNGNVTDLLLAGALDELGRRGVAEQDRTVVWVSGAFELPLAAMVAARTGRYDAVICLGAVIRGETSHYDIVSGECAAGVQRVQLEMGLPVVFGVLTTDNLEQALARAGGTHGNKGTEAALTAIEMVSVVRQLVRARPGGAHSARAAQRAP